MKVFGIGDLHLSFLERMVSGSGQPVKQHKPMDIFGPSWENHYQKIYDRWINTVAAEDLVLVPGDISWAMTLEEAAFDLDFLGSLPGKIVLVRGNHDYWWRSISQVRRALPPNVSALQNDCLFFEGIAVCGSRGWPPPGSTGFNSDDEKVYLRELHRVELSLISVPRETKKIILMLHYMPTAENHASSGFTDLMEKYKVSICVYGHLHAWSHSFRLPERKWNVDFSLVSADFLNFSPRLLLAENEIY